MSEIEVGEYVRTFSGEIAKITGIGTEFNSKVYLTNKYITSSRDYYVFEDDTAITKHSKNIIDLIEIGDYVNGSLINYIPDDEDVKKVYHDAQDMCDVELFSNEDIKTILTHEQYEANCYKVGDISI